MFGRNDNPEDTQRKYTRQSLMETLDEYAVDYPSPLIDDHYHHDCFYPSGASQGITNRNQRVHDPYSGSRMPGYGIYRNHGYMEEDIDLIYPNPRRYSSPVEFQSTVIPESDVEVFPRIPYHPHPMSTPSRLQMPMDMHDNGLYDFHSQQQLQQRRRRQFHQQQQRQQQQQYQQPIYSPSNCSIDREMEYSPVNRVNPINSISPTNSIPGNSGRGQSILSSSSPQYPTLISRPSYPYHPSHVLRPPYSFCPPFPLHSLPNTPHQPNPTYSPIPEPVQDGSFTFHSPPTSIQVSDHYDHFLEEDSLTLSSSPTSIGSETTTDTRFTPVDPSNSTQNKPQPENTTPTSSTNSDSLGKYTCTIRCATCSTTWQKETETQSPLVAEEVRQIIQEVFSWPYYSEIWHQIERTSDGQSVCLVELLKKSPKDSPPSLEKLIRECIYLKKACKMLSARKLFLSLLDAFNGDPAIWVDFSRMEMESGEYQNALVLLHAARKQYPYNQVLVIKLVKVEEKLHMGNELIQIAEELLEDRNLKAMRLLCNVLLALARIGHAQYARTVTLQLANSLAGYPGWLCYEILSLIHYFEQLPVVHRTINQILGLYPKHGPMWMFAMRWTENIHNERWSQQSVYDLIYNQEYVSIVERAKKSLTVDILWKILLENMQGNARMIFILRFCFYYKIDCREKVIAEQYKKFIHQARNCLELANSSQHWKIFATLARLSVAFGSPCLSQKLFKRALMLCPEKTHHEILLDYGKALFAMLRQREATALLTRGSLQFPEEWKLVLQLVQELLFQNRCLDALYLCRRATSIYFGAGRLWSVYIHLIHKLVGPIQALHYWRIALRYVAKSGEIWCEGARIFLNPSSTLFSLHNARVALNFSVFFTPQYGDSFIEGVRLLMLSSNTFLRFWDCPDKLFLSSLLLSIPSLYSFIHLAVFSNPNYGPMWYRCQSGLLSSMQETFIHAVRMCALTLSQHSEMYYDAIRRSAREKMVGRDNKQQALSFCYGQLSQGIDMQYGKGETPRPNMDYLFKALFGSYPVHMTL